MNPTAPNGLLVLDKPVGVTSRDAVDRALRWFPRRTRVGHTGTLDPLAGGVLVLCVGQATRLTEYVQSMPKTYLADVVLGATSATDDVATALMSRASQSHRAVEFIYAGEFDVVLQFFRCDVDTAASRCRYLQKSFLMR